MIKIQKIAVWKIGDRYFEIFHEAEKEVLRMLLKEMLQEENTRSAEWDPESISRFLSSEWDNILAKLRSVMAGI